VEDVALGDKADQAIVSIDDGQATETIQAHYRGDLLEAGLGGGRTYVSGHHFIDAHDLLLWAPVPGLPPGGISS
jgi:hypothetical protein